MFDDPGYRDTARLVCESGLTILYDLEKTNSKGGFYTPATGLGEFLLDRILNSGSALKVEEV